jgi:preprotein translocase subunit SecY
MKTTFSGWRYLWKSEDIRRKLLITIALLALYRIAANVPVPGVDRVVLDTFRTTASGSGNFLDFLDLLSGGTVSNFSLLSMGVYPYITAQIILQLLVPIIPALQRRMEEDPREGRRWMEKWTYYLAVPMAALSAIGQINIFNSLPGRWADDPAVFLAGSVAAIVDHPAGHDGWHNVCHLDRRADLQHGVRGQGLSLASCRHRRRMPRTWLAAGG